MAGAAAAVAAQSAAIPEILQIQNGRSGSARDGFDRGYREGLRQGEIDARRGLAFDIQRDQMFRDGTRGYERRFGSRDLYRDDFRRGFTEGYRSSYTKLRRTPAPPALDRNAARMFGSQPRSGGYQEPAYARGYSDGYRQGTDDGRDRDRYDAVGQRDYRDADEGYSGAYGSRDAYRNNYRAGYREGYEEGYRQGNGRR